MYAKKLALFEEETNADVFTFSQAVNLQESSSLKRYRVCIAVPLNRNRETYMKSAAKAAKKRQLVGKMRDNANIEKIEVEIEGQANQLADFINDIKGGPEHVNKNVMAVVEIPPLNCETSFVLQKQPLPIS
jgi:acylphosphatase